MARDPGKRACEIAERAVKLSLERILKDAPKLRALLPAPLYEVVAPQDRLRRRVQNAKMLSEKIKRLALLSRKCAEVRTFLFLPRRVLPSYLTGVTFPTTARIVPDVVPPLLVGLATGRAVSVASRCIPLCTIYKSI